MSRTYDIIIVGGGLAGLTAAIELSGSFDVLLIEKKEYPSHKVCGEYISKEVQPYLSSLGLDLAAMALPEIDEFKITTLKGDSAHFELPLGGFGVSRYLLDHTLLKLAKAKGCNVLNDRVESIEFKGGSFIVGTKSEKLLRSKVCLGAFGKRSNLDLSLQRNFIRHRTSWLAVKAHYRLTAFPDNLVALHNFKGGYAGLSKVENDHVNFCYLADQRIFSKAGGVDQFNEEVLAQNPFLERFLKNAEPLFQKSLTIAQVSFERKELVKDHVLMCGDSAGLIHPLCGNGMAMAIHAAKIVSNAIKNYLEHDTVPREQMEKGYADAWNQAFRSRLYWSRMLQKGMLNHHLAGSGIKLLANYPFLARNLIKNTHGSPLLC